MTGYTARERFLTIVASIAPYPFMVATLWTPFTLMPALLCLGMSLYATGMTLFVLSLKVIIRTPPHELFSSGPYHFTRNPLYVAATFVFMGICLATANVVLAGYLAIAVILQHFMILAEERICMEKYGKEFESYMQRAPRYLFIRGRNQIG
jgi:protein-S-isoprenylcysteine O-methyltransferase Ste14